MKALAVPLKIDEPITKATCLTKVDFEIFTKIGGKEKALRIMQIIAGIRRGKKMRDITN